MIKIRVYISVALSLSLSLKNLPYVLDGDASSKLQNLMDRGAATAGSDHISRCDDLRTSHVKQTPRVL